MEKIRFKPFLLVAILAVFLIECRGEKLWANIEVRDERDHPVTNAVVYVRALNNARLNAGAYAGDYSLYSASADTNGVAIVGFESYNDFVYVWAVAEGYYNGRKERLRYRTVCKDDRFFEFVEREAHMRMTLCRKRNPIPMYGLSRNDEILLPKDACAVQLDLKLGELLPPFGNGECADVVISTWASNDVDRIVAGGVLQFPSGGAYKVMRESPYQVFYAADTNQVYSPSFACEHAYVVGERRPVGGNLLADDEVLVVRTRMIRDAADGNRVRCNYAYIMGPVGIDDGVRLVNGQWKIGLRAQLWMSHGPIVFNPADNDCNLEIDWDRNLTQRKAKLSHRGGM